MNRTNHAQAGERRCKHCGEDISHRRKNALFCNDRCYAKHRWPRRAKPGTIRRCKHCRMSIEHRGAKAEFCDQTCWRAHRRSKRRRKGPPVQPVPLGRFVTPEMVRGGTACGSARVGFNEQLYGAH